MSERVAKGGRTGPNSYRQTFYVGHVDNAGERRFTIARIKSPAYQTLVTVVLGEICSMVDYTEAGWAGGRIDAGVMPGDEASVIRMVAAAVGGEATVVDKGQVLVRDLEAQVGKSIADIIVGPRPVVTTPLPRE